MSDAIKFINSDSSEILKSMVNDYEKIYEELTGKPITLIESDEYMAQVASLAYRFSLYSSALDKAAKNNLIEYATGDYLDAIGARLGKERGQASPAKTTLEFRLIDALTEIASIPAGTILKGGNFFFATDQYAEIPAGDLAIEVKASCTTPGIKANNILPGQIKTIVTELPYAVTVTNLTATQGGTDKQDDEDYRESIRQAPLTFSVAGPKLAYESIAKAFNEDIIDVKASSPTPGTIDIRFILKGGELPSQTLIEELQAYLSDSTRRPLTDKVMVSAPSQVPYSIDCTYYISSNDADRVEAIKAAADQAKDDYILWQKSKIKRDIDSSELLTRLKSIGVKRCVITSPQYAVIGQTEVASCDSINFVYGGLEDE